MLVMENVFAPITVNSFVIEFLIESMAVSIPTNAEIPIAMINTVRIVRSKLLRTDCNAIRMFSIKSAVPRIYNNFMPINLKLK
jgi:hypothetical protein